AHVAGFRWPRTAMGSQNHLHLVILAYLRRLADRPLGLGMAGPPGHALHLAGRRVPAARLHRQPLCVRTHIASMSKILFWVVTILVVLIAMRILARMSVARQ